MTTLRILGPATAGPEARPLRGQQGRLLVTLLLQRGDVVTTSQAIRWSLGDPAPLDAEPRLHVLMSRLRRDLRSSEVPVDILTVGSGYRLDCAPEVVDAAVFEHLVATAPPDGDRRRACLARALGLWRGELAEGLGLEAHPVARRLGELRASAADELLSLRLVLPTDLHALTEAMERCRAAPEREQFVATTMRALYRAGRQADALKLYGEVRHALRESFGLHPGVELERLELQILRQEPVAPISSGQRSRRHAAPTPIDDFIGRGEELRRLAATHGSHRLTTVLGPGGVGKTRLVLEHAAQQCPGDVWFVDLSALSNGSEIGHAVARVLDLQAAPHTSIEDLVVEHLRSHDGVLVLDNCEHVLASAKRLTANALHASPQLRIVTTSREALNLLGEQCLVLGPLRPTEQTDLFRYHAEASGSAARLADDEILGACEALDGLPLAIIIAAGQLRTMTLTELTDRLDERLGSLRAQRPEAPRHHSVESVITWSFELLSRAEQRLLVRLSVFVGSFDRTAVAAVCAGPDDPTDVEPVLTALVDKSLVVASTEGRTTRFRLLDTVRHFAQRRRDDPDLGARHGRHYGELLATARAALPADRYAALVDVEFANVRVAFNRSIQDGDVDLAGSIISSLTTYAEFRPGLEVLEWARTLLEVEPGSEHARRAHVIAGGITNCIADWAASEQHYRAASRLDGDPPGQRSFSALVGLASPLIFLGRARESIQVADRAVALAVESGDPTRVAVARCVRSYVAAYAQVPLDITELEAAAEADQSMVCRAYALSAYACQLMRRRHPAAPDVHREAAVAADHVRHRHMQCIHRSYSAFGAGDDPDLGALLGLRTSLVAYGQAKLPFGPRQVAGECYEALAHAGRWQTVATMRGATPPVSIFADEARRAKAEARRRLGAAAYDDAVARGRALSHEAFERFLDEELDRLSVPHVAVDLDG